MCNPIWEPLIVGTLKLNYALIYHLVDFERHSLDSRFCLVWVPAASASYWNLSEIHIFSCLVALSNQKLQGGPPKFYLNKPFSVRQANLWELL
jgi:hypothetical protein